MTDDTRIVTLTEQVPVSAPAIQREVVTLPSETTILVDSPVNQIVEIDKDAFIVESSPEINVVTVGEAGQPGLNGSGALEFPFAYGDATPAAVTTATAGKMVYGVQVNIKTPFDGTGAALVVGDAGQANRLMAATENDPFNVGNNITNPAHAYAAGTGILLGITPGAGATQGAGLLVLHIQQ